MNVIYLLIKLLDFVLFIKMGGACTKLPQEKDDNKPLTVNPVTDDKRNQVDVNDEASMSCCSSIYRVGVSFKDKVFFSSCCNAVGNVEQKG